MKIQPVSQNCYNNPKVTFKGYDCRPLKALVLSTNEGHVAEDLQKLCKKFKVDVFYSHINPDVQGKLENKNLEKISSSYFSFQHRWAQDYVITTPNKVFSRKAIGVNLAKEISSQFNIPYQAWDCNKANLPPGGNYFITKNGTQNELLIGENELLKNSIDEIKEIFDVKKVIPLPMIDAHIDLAIRPLEDKKVLIADDNLMIEGIDKMILKFDDYTKKTSNVDKTKYEKIVQNLIKIKEAFTIEIRKNKWASTDEVEKVLISNGYTPIRVPGRLYSIKHTNFSSDDFMTHSLNYMNAIPIKAPNGEIQYITNRTLLDRNSGITPKISSQVGMSFEKIFTDSIKKYIPAKNIHYVGEEDTMNSILENAHGGIHCITTEIQI